MPHPEGINPVPRQVNKGHINCRDFLEKPSFHNYFVHEKLSVFGCSLTQRVINRERAGRKAFFSCPIEIKMSFRQECRHGFEVPSLSLTDE